MTAPRTIIIGLYGGVGSGKSTIAALFAELGAVVLDADAEVRAVYAEPATIAAVRKAFGADAITDDGTPDRRFLADRIFSDAAARRRLEAIIHPRVIARLREQTDAAQEAGAPAVILDVPLLATSPLRDALDAGVFVDAPLAVREARVAVSRGWDPAELERRDASQPSLEAKRALCQHVVTNDVHTTTDDLRAQVRTIWSAFTAQPARP
ncbi:MAG: dephospho-CoA kinase [Planctomycetota bacterium]